MKLTRRMLLLCAIELASGCAIVLGNYCAAAREAIRNALRC